MENKVYSAAINGDTTFFLETINNSGSSSFLMKTSQDNNIIHIAAQYEQFSFTKEVLSRLSMGECVSLISDKNCHGNTAVHVALLYGNLSVAVCLLKKDGSLSRVTNNYKETILHLAIRYYIRDVRETSKILRKFTIWPIIIELLSIDSSVVCWADVNGVTPLHLAVSLKPAYRLPVIKAMLAWCPQAAEVLEPCSGQSVLHLLANHKVPSYEDGIELMKIPQVHALRYNMNNDGDTPLHVAARNLDTIMVQVLKGELDEVPIYHTLGIKNKAGVSAHSLLRQLDEIIITGERRRRLTNEEYKAAKLLTDMDYLDQKLESLGLNFLVSQPPNGGNILHTLMCRILYTETGSRAQNFIAQAIKKYPLLINQQDCNGDTPIHVLVRKTNSLLLLDLSFECFQKAQEAANNSTCTLYFPPWRMKNVKGDTPLHTAVRKSNYDAAIKLIEFDQEVAGYVNNRKETPLHLMCHHCESVNQPQADSLINCLIEANDNLPNMHDEDGLTPLLIAAQTHNFQMFRKLREFPESLEMVDKKGRTLWHMFVLRPYETDTSDQTFKDKIDISSGNLYLGLAGKKDNDGNTALHMAIANRHFNIAIFLIDNVTSEVLTTICNSNKELLAVENNEGVTSYDMIGYTDHLPPEFKEHLSKKGLLFGHRSLYSVPTTKIENYVNTIGVTAALLATITFTAAFTVPGGLDSAKGTPLLLKKAAFQVFMISDVLAMCLSIMVLFCLLWIITTNHKKKSLLLLDVSVFLLQLSFYATFLTFMTGLYVTTRYVVPAIAIFALVVCSILIVIMRKSLVMVTVVPVCTNFIIRWRKLKGFLSNQGSFLIVIMRKSLVMLTVVPFCTNFIIRWRKLKGLLSNQHRPVPPGETVQPSETVVTVPPGETVQPSETVPPGETVQPSLTVLHLVSQYNTLHAHN